MVSFSVSFARVRGSKGVVLRSCFWWPACAFRVWTVFFWGFMRGLYWRRCIHPNHSWVFISVFGFTVFRVKHVFFLLSLKGIYATALAKTHTPTTHCHPNPFSTTPNKSLPHRTTYYIPPNAHAYPPPPYQRTCHKVLKWTYRGSRRGTRGSPGGISFTWCWIVGWGSWWRCRKWGSRCRRPSQIFICGGQCRAGHGSRSSFGLGLWGLSVRCGILWRPPWFTRSCPSFIQLSMWTLFFGVSVIVGGWMLGARLKEWYRRWSQKRVRLCRRRDCWLWLRGCADLSPFVRMNRCHCCCPFFVIVNQLSSDVFIYKLYVGLVWHVFKN